MSKLGRTTAALVAVALLGAIATSAIAGNDPNKLRAGLNGVKEIPDADPNGAGTAFVTLKGGVNRVCFNISYEKIGKPLAGHIHRGGKRANGAIVVPLFEGARPGGSPITGCANDVAGATINQIRNNPGGFYVNLHNSAYPAGAIRGQLKVR
jgi:hypothetical protein